MSKRKSVAIVATLDTKGKEAEYIRNKIAAQGIDTILIDSGVLGVPAVEATVSREEVAKAAGVTIDELKKQNKKSAAIAKQAEGLRSIVQKLFGEGKLDGIIGIGGGQGTSICTTAMQALPIGFPKLMLSTVASGRFRFGPYVGTKDICMMFSVADIAGLNAISLPIFDNAANAIAGMVLRKQTKTTKKTAIALTMLGITTPCCMQIKAGMEVAGYEVVAFHASGTGGAAMEELIEAGKFVGVIDISTHELINQLYGGLTGAPHRLEALTKTNTPAVISVGGIDVLAFESLAKAPEELRGRPTVIHNAQIVHIRPKPEQMIKVAQVMAERLNRALGPTMVTIPMKGFSEYNKEGSELWDPEGNEVFVATLQAELSPRIPIIQVDAHINDALFAEVSTTCLSAMLHGQQPTDIATHISRDG